MLTDEQLALALAELGPEIRARLVTLLRYGWGLEAERVLAGHLGEPVRAKEIIASMVRRQLTN